MSQRAAGAPVAVLQAALQSFVEGPAGTATKFIPASKFVLAKPGYYFSAGPQGTGYYLDPEAAKPQDVVEPAVEKRQLPAARPAEELLAEAEEQAGEQTLGLLDARSLKRLVATFERKHKENMEARMKFGDNPEKFLESEVDLDEEIRKLQAVTATPDLYPELVKLGAIPTLATLLSHENGDIVAAVIELLRDLTDSDAVEELEEEAKVLVEAMVGSNMLELLVHRLGSLDERNAAEDKAVFDTLAVFENMIELDPDVATQVVGRTKLLKWIMGRIKPREFDSTKQYVSELLSILLQGNRKNQETLASMGGVDSLLQVLHPFIKRDPQNSDEEEHIENLFNALCSCLMSDETRRAFVEAEGVELMVLMLKARRFARAGALKALDFALTRSQAACEHFVETLGLKPFCAMFMGRTKVSRRAKKEGMSDAEVEERCISIISNLFQGLGRGSLRDRVSSKFVENEFEKCDRLMEIFARYFERVGVQQRRLDEMVAAGQEDVDDEYKQSALMEAGRYTLQQAALIIGQLWFVGDMGVRRRILLLLHQQSNTLAKVRAVLREYHDGIGLEGGAEEKDRQQGKLRSLLSALGLQDDITPTPAAPIPDTAAAPSPALPDGATLANGTANGVAADETAAAVTANGLDADVKMELDGFVDAGPEAAAVKMEIAADDAAAAPVKEEAAGAAAPQPPAAAGLQEAQPPPPPPESTAAPSTSGLKMEDEAEGSRHERHRDRKEKKEKHKHHRDRERDGERRRHKEKRRRDSSSEDDDRQARHRKDRHR